jgi:hypothetical protein
MELIENLRDTEWMMESDNYKERFLAEYVQTKIRYKKLHAMCIKYEAGTLEFELTCPIDLLKDQSICMSNYLYDLEVRAEIEGIELS